MYGDVNEGVPITLTSFLTFNVPMAIGGTYKDLLATHGLNTKSIVSRWDSKPLEVDTLEQAVTALGLKSLAAKNSEES